MITVEKLSFSFPEKDLYQNITFTIEEGKHCALIGTNGTGKTTLVDMLRDPEKYMYDGKIKFEETCKLGYVCQKPKIEAQETTVFDFLCEPFVAMQNKMNQVCVAMETAEDMDLLMEEYQQCMDEFDAVDGHNYDSNIKKNLKLGNLHMHENVPISKVSGGELKLILIIKEMLLRPNLLIMDEPDVFLDFEHLNGLKDLINSFKESMLVITHNRYILNHCFNKILHLENTALLEWEGTYATYQLSLLKRKIELQEKAMADLAEIERNQKIVNNLRREATIHTCAARGRAVHARASLLERLEQRRVKEPFVDIKEPEFPLHADAVAEGVTALVVENYNRSFDKPLLEQVCFEIKSDEKVAIVGPNGSGKTTLLRDILEGNHAAIHVNEEIKLAYLSQNKEGVSATDLDCMEKLSSGERSVCELKRIAEVDANFLLLDEPTSDLDLYAQIAFEKAIAQYNGAVLMISHDFYTIANCMDYVLLIENHTIRKIRIRKFRQNIYSKYFKKEYLELENKKKDIELQIAYALQETKFQEANALCQKLEEVIGGCTK